MRSIVVICAVVVVCGRVDVQARVKPRQGANKFIKMFSEELSRCVKTINSSTAQAIFGIHGKGKLNEVNSNLLAIWCLSKNGFDKLKTMSAQQQRPFSSHRIDTLKTCMEKIVAESSGNLDIEDVLMTLPECKVADEIDSEESVVPSERWFQQMGLGPWRG